MQSEMPARYEQFCPAARAAEILGQRWSLLILRDLLSSPELRFSDLRERLPGISSSVLSERLSSLEERGVVERRELPPPAASSVYALTPAGRALRPAMLELVRWGMRFMTGSLPGDHFDPHWAVLGFEAAARRGPVPALSLQVALRHPLAPVEFCIRGGPEGARVEPGRADPVDAELEAEGRSAILVMAGVLPLAQAEAAGLASVRGDRSVVERMPDLFDVPVPVEATETATPDPAS